MIKIALGVALLLNSCGSSNNGNSGGSSGLTKENLVGHWKLTKVKVSGKEAMINGLAIRQYKSDGTFVDAGEKYYSDGNEASPCWYTGSGKFEIKDAILVETIEKEVGPKGCVEGDFNPKNYSTAVSTNSITSKAEDGTEYVYEKYTAKKDFDYTTFLEKFEKVTFTVDDPDKATSVNLVYRNPKQGGWTALCPRLHGEETSGFTVSSTFTYNNSIYELSSQWSEGDISPANYSGSSPRFEFEKRSASSSDSGGGSGSGRYTCASVTDCQAKCTLTITGYSLTDGAATLTYSCTALPAASSGDSDNLFGSTLTNTTLKAECNYKPSLDL